jgi:glutaredoxin 3
MTVMLTAVAQSGYWRVKMAWPDYPPRFFGRFDTEAEAELWIAEHRWLIEQHAEPNMAAKRKIEIFSAGCALCNEVIDAVRREAGSSSEVVVRDMMDARVLSRAQKLGIRSVPAVAIDGKVVPGVDIQTLKDAGLGRAP